MKASTIGDLTNGIEHNFDFSEIVLQSGEKICSSYSEVIRVVEYYKSWAGVRKEGCGALRKDLERITCYNAKSFKIVADIARSEPPAKMSMDSQRKLLKVIIDIGRFRNFELRPN